MCGTPPTPDQKKQTDADYLNTFRDLDSEQGLKDFRTQMFNNNKRSNAAFADEINRASDNELRDWIKGTKEKDQFKYTSGRFKQVYETGTPWEDLKSQADEMAVTATPDMGDGLLKSHARNNLLKGRYGSTGRKGSFLGGI
jgi:hypothetical protein